MSIAALSHRYVFGLKGDVNGNIFYIDETNVLYPAGSNSVIYNIEAKSQKFLPSSEKSEGITAMSVSASRKFAAIAERGEKAACIIYDIHSLRKRKVISVPDSDVKEFAAIAFSADGKFLVTLTLASDCILSLWAWEKQKLLNSIKVTTPAVDKSATNNNSLGSSVSINPADSSQVVVVVNGYLKLFKLQEGVLKVIAIQKTDVKNYASHCWTTDDRLVLGTDDGKILVFESTGEFRNEIQYINSTTQNFRGIHSLTPFAKGFIAGCAGGAAAIYERNEEANTTGTQVLSVQNALSKELFKKAKEFNLQDSSAKVMSMALSPSEDNIICSFDNCQLYNIQLSGADVKGDDAKFETFSQSFHHGIITGMDTCIRKPLIVTCSSDHSIRVWNYLDTSSELVKYFSEEAFSVSMHPSGLYILVGFSDKLRLMNLLIDDIRPYREFTIRGCRECKFSNGGQFFAAVHGNSIQIYSTWSFENLCHLKGHNGKVRSIYWSSDDLKLVTAGMDGAVYEWNLRDLGAVGGSTGRRDGECILKTCSYSCAIASPDSRAIFAVGSDKTLKEIIDSQIVRELESDVVLSQVILSHSGKMMFVGTMNGTIRAMKYPLSPEAHEYQDHQAHASPITKLRISYDDQFLFSVAEDGCLFIYRVVDKEGRVAKREKDMIFADEILVTKSDLEEKNTLMLELKARVEELKMENEYQLRLKDMNFNEKIKEVTEKFLQEIEALKITSTVLKTDKEKEEIRHEEEMNDETEKHNKELQELEAVHNGKLMAEYEKYQDLQAKTAELQAQWERQMQDMQDAKDQALHEMTTHFEARLKDKQIEYENLQQEMAQHYLEFEESTRETERDSDQEILEIKHKYEKKLKEEREAVLRLKGENGVMRKKFNTLQSEIDAHKVEIAKMFAEEKKLHSITKSLEKDILGLKKEIQERDETIQDKEKRIYDLKKKNQELEKFKFVLDYKIKELKKQIEPREQDIQGMTVQIKEMDIELQQYNKNNSALELSIADLKLKVKASEKEVDSEKERVKAFLAIVRRFKVDINDCVQHIQDPKAMKTHVKRLYQKYCKDTTRSKECQEVDAQQEYARQRDYLERTVDSLRYKLQKDQESHRADNVKIMTENVSLIKEINQLRRNIVAARTKERALETDYKLSKLDSTAPAAEEKIKQPKLPQISDASIVSP